VTKATVTKQNKLNANKLTKHYMDLVKSLFVSKFLPSCSCHLLRRKRLGFLLKLCLQFLHFTCKICPDQAYITISVL